MIEIDFKMPSEAELKRTLMAKAEQQITQTAQQAAAPQIPMMRYMGIRVISKKT